jgi:hypothetical protein
MGDGLSRLSDDDLTRLRGRIEQLMRTGLSNQRSAASAQLEAVDIERERRISAPLA